MEDSEEEELNKVDPFDSVSYQSDQDDSVFEGSDELSFSEVNEDVSQVRDCLLYTSLGANKHIISCIKPGVSCAQLNEWTKEYYYRALKSIGLISSEDEVEKYYYHGVSHHLGLDVHDVGLKNEPLAPGMVITVEPGLYIEEYGIGIRIEDDVLVTAKGCEVLTDVLKEPEEIEEFMDIWEVK